MLDEEIVELLETHKALAKALLADPEIRKLNAQVAMQTYNAFVEVGFSRDEALALTCASLKAK